MENTSTTPADNPADVPAPGASVVEEPNTGTEQTQTVDNNENLETSTSTDTSAADDKSKQTTEENKDDTPASTKFDDDLDEWISKRGAPKPTTEDERKAYQELRNGQREFTREQQAKKQAEELSKAINSTKDDAKSEDEEEDDDPIEKRLREIENDRNAERDARLQSEFYTENKVSGEEGKAIVEIFDEKMKRETDDAERRRAFEYWSSPKRLPDLLELAKARLSQVDTDALKEAAQEEERERIARESEANSSGRGAKTTVTSDKSDDDRRLESFSNWD